MLLPFDVNVPPSDWNSWLRTSSPLASYHVPATFAGTIQR